MSVRALAARIEALPRPLLLGLDVDGTLAPIVEEAGAARVPAAVLADLRAIAARADVEVALLTGRDAASLAEVAPLDGLWRAVEHGRVRIAPDGATSGGALDEEGAAALEALTQRLAPLEARGARLERKPAARAVHVRRLDAAEGEAILAEVRAHAEALGLHARSGRAVVEVEAEPGDKGVALSAIADALGAASAVFAGDDLTDAPAMTEARRRGGLGLFVKSAERPSAPVEVDGVLAGPADVARLLRVLTAP